MTRARWSAAATAVFAIVAAGAVAPIRSQTTRDLPAAATSGGGITGRVFAAGEPDIAIRGARVTLARVDSGPVATTITDGEGLFSFDGLMNGRYSIAVAKAAYLATEYGALRPGRPGRIVTIGPGSPHAAIVVALQRGAVITGTVLNEQGQPVPGAQVFIVKRAFDGGFRTLTRTPAQSAQAGSGGSALTDDRGVFRLYGLAPDDYLVGVERNRPSEVTLRQTTPDDVRRARAMIDAAQEQRAGRPSAPTVLAGGFGGTTPRPLAAGYAPVFYPGTPSASSAIPVTVAAGEERSDVNIVTLPSRLGSVRGTVSDSGGAPLTDVLVRLVPTEPSLQSSALLPLARDGTFQFSGLAPGNYVIEARTAPSAARSAARWAAAPLVVFDGLDARVDAALQRSTTVTGTVSFRDGAASASTRVDVVLTPEPFLKDSLRSEQRAPAAAGRFSFGDVPPGRYRLRVDDRGATVAGNGWTLDRATADGSDVTDVAFDIGSGSPLAVTLALTHARARFEGTLQVPDGAVPLGYSVVVFSAEPRHWFRHSRWIRAAPFADDGSFAIDGLSAGEYLVAVVDDVEPGEWFDPTFLEALAPAAVRFSIEPGQTVTQTFRVAKP